MRKVLSVVLMVLLCMSLTACGCEHEFDEGTITTEPTCTEEGVKTFTCTKCEKTKTEPVPVIDHDYVAETTKEATFTEEGIMTYTCSVCGDSYEEAIPVRKEKVVVTVTGLEKTPKNTNAWIFSNYVTPIIKLENMTDKDIRGVQGVLITKDIFGEPFLSAGCDFTGQTIPAHGSIIVDTMQYEINEFIDEDMKFFNTAYEDLQFDYVCQSIVYADGTKEDQN